MICTAFNQSCTKPSAFFSIADRIRWPPQCRTISQHVIVLNLMIKMLWAFNQNIYTYLNSASDVLAPNGARPIVDPAAGAILTKNLDALSLDFNNSVPPLLTEWRYSLWPKGLAKSRIFMQSSANHSKRCPVFCRSGLNVAGICSQASNWQQDAIGSSKGLVLNSHFVINWTSDGLSQVYLRRYTYIDSD